MACCGSGSRLIATQVVEEAPASPIVPAGSRRPQRPISGPRPAAADGGGLLAAVVAVGSRRRSAVGGRRRRRSAAGGGGSRRPPQRDRQRSAAVTCLARPRRGALVTCLAAAALEAAGHIKQGPDPCNCQQCPLFAKRYFKPSKKKVGAADA